MARVAIEQPRCAQRALQGVRELLGRRMVVQSDREAEVQDLIARLGRAECGDKAQAAKTRELIARADRLRDARVLGELVQLAMRRDKCSDPALATARSIVGAQGLALACAAPKCPPPVQTTSTKKKR